MMHTRCRSSSFNQLSESAKHRHPSWLLTTDHKRIGLLYVASITFFFFVGGFFALLMRLSSAGAAWS